MSVPVPRLDDRHFQDLVDEAKRRIADRCPEWTDHNVSDPGVTLIELFAQMVDETVYRLNRVPEKMQAMLLDLVGMGLRPAHAAEADLTFWLASPERYWEAAEGDVSVLAAAGVEVATARSGTETPVSFRISEDVRLTRASVAALHTGAGTRGRAEEDPVRRRSGTDLVPVFGDSAPSPGAAFFVELGRSLPGCAVRLDLECDPNRGSGIVPDDPPWEWSAWCDDGWRGCEVDRDTTGGLNRSGSVFLHVPAEQVEHGFPGTADAGWLRCRLTDPGEGRPFYESSPAVGAVTALTLGGTVPSSQADLLVRDEVIGVSDGTYGQPPFQLRRTPLAAGPVGGPLLLAGDDPQPWAPVDGFEVSAETDRHYVLDRVSGQLRLGLAVRQQDGRVRRYGAVPPAGAPLRVVEYHVGGGSRGNVRATALRVLKSPVPGVRAVENRHAAGGGSDAETVEQAMIRAPVFLRQRTRAVTLEDFAWLAQEASGHVARAHALPGGTAPDDALSVRVLVVPALPLDAGLASPLRQADLVDVPETMTRVARYLDDRRLVGTRVLVTPPRYVPVRVRARVLLDQRADRRVLAARTREALHAVLHPLVGGRDGAGWPFGEEVRVEDLRGALLGVAGVARVESVLLVDEQEETAGEVLEVPEGGLPLSLDHVVDLA